MEVERTSTRQIWKCFGLISHNVFSPKAAGPVAPSFQILRGPIWRYFVMKLPSRSFENNDVWFSLCIYGPLVILSTFIAVCWLFFVNKNASPKRFSAKLQILRNYRNQQDEQTWGERRLRRTGKTADKSYESIGVSFKSFGQGKRPETHQHNFPCFQHF